MPAPASAPPVLKLRRSILRTAVVSGVVSCLVAGLALYLEYQACQSANCHDLRKAAALFKENLNLTLNSLGSLLRDTAQHLSQEADNLKNAGGLLARPGINLLSARLILVLNAQGKVAASSHRRGQYLGLNLRDYAFFQAHQQANQPGLFVGPLTRLPASQAWGLPVSRAARGGDGSLKAVVAAFIGPEYLQSLFALNDLGPGAGCILAHKDGTLLARFPWAPREANDSAASFPLLDRHFTRAAKGAVGELAWLDGQRRLVAFAALNPHPLVIALSMSPGHARDLFYGRVRQWAILLAVVLGLISGAAYYLIRKPPLKTPDRRVSLTGFEASRRAKLLLNPRNGGIVYANQAACRFYGHSLERLTQLSLLELSASGPANPLAELRGLIAGPASTHQAAHCLASGEIRQVKIQAGPALLGREKLFCLEVCDLPPVKEVREKSSGESRYLKALHETTLKMMQRLDLSAVLQSIVAQAAEIMNSPHGWICTVEEKKDVLINRHGVGLFSDRAGDTFKPGQGLSGKIWRGRRPLQLKDYGTYPGRVSGADLDVIGPTVAVPLQVGLRVLGVLGLARKQGALLFKQEEIETLNQFARLASIALENARLYTAAQREVGQRRQTEKWLKESEAKYRSTFEGSPDAICITERQNGKILEINRGFSEISGYARQEVEGKTALELGLYVDPFDRERFYQLVKEKGEINNFDCRFRCKDGGVIDGLFSTRPLVYGGKHCLVSVVRNITPLKKAAQERAKLMAQLQQAQKMEAVGILAGGVAHDFNNVLQTILGFTQIMQQSPTLADSHRAALNKIENAVDQATEMTRQLLTFSRKVESNLKPLNLNRQIKETAEFLARIFPKMIKIELRLAPQLKPALADPTQIQQVLLNLGTNAKDAMPHGGRLLIETQNLTVTSAFSQAHPELKPGDYLRMRVADTGEGMDEKTISHIFQPFFTTKALGRGTGLGLSMVYGIIKNHRGYIHCQSSPGKGTVFDLYLPACPGRPESQADNGGAGAVRGGEETVLVVEGDRSIRQMTLQMLKKAAYTVYTAPDGERALKICQAQGDKIGLIILETDLPGMGSEKFLQGLLALIPLAKVLLLTDAPTASPAAEPKATPPRPYIVKPFKQTTFLQKVRELLDA